MGTKPHILLLTLFFLAFAAVPPVRADLDKSKEYQIKAAFIYNFIKFVDWPEEEKADTNEPMTIGIIGSEEFIKAFGPIKGRKIKDRCISVKYFAGYEKLKAGCDADDSEWQKKMEALKRCHVLMFCTCHSVRIRTAGRIVRALSGLPVLTVGETDGFLESGGNVNFVMEDEKVRFEINNASARKSKLEIRSKLLRLARRVIDERTSKEAEN